MFTVLIYKCVPARRLDLVSFMLPSNQRSSEDTNVYSHSSFHVRLSSLMRGVSASGVSRLRHLQDGRGGGVRCSWGPPCDEGEGGGHPKWTLHS